MKWYLSVLRNYYGFKGRASLREYWMFILFNAIIAILAMVMDHLFKTTMTLDYGTQFIELPYGYIYLTYVIAVFIPGLAVLVRRLHDIGKSGWMILVTLIPFAGILWLLILTLEKSYPGANKYGPVPGVDIMS